MYNQNIIFQAIHAPKKRAIPSMVKSPSLELGCLSKSCESQELLFIQLPSLYMFPGKEFLEGSFMLSISSLIKTPIFINIVSIFYHTSTTLKRRFNMNIDESIDE